VRAAAKDGDAGATGGPVLRPEHGRLLFDLAVRYLIGYGRRDRGEFRRLGYLAPALDYYFATDQRAQVERATMILRNACGTRLGKGDIAEVLGGAAYPPTDALLAAIIQLAPGQAEFAMTEYGRARSAELVPAYGRGRLRDRLPALPSQRRRGPGEQQREAVRPAGPRREVLRPAGPSVRRTSTSPTRSGRRGQNIVLAIGLVVILVMVLLAFAAHLL
jgi:hypothetical protein